MNSLIDRFLFIGGHKSKIKDYKVNNDITLETLCAYSTYENMFMTNPTYAPSTDLIKFPELWTSIEKETETLLKFVLPFGIKLKHERIDNQLEKLNQILLRDDSSNNRTEFFCIAINPPEEEQAKFYAQHNTTQLSSESNKLGNNLDAKKQKALLTESNPNNFNYYFCLKYNDVFVKRSSSGLSLDLFSVPKLFAFRSKFPLSVFFHDLLKKLLGKLRKLRITEYMQASSGITNQKIASEFMTPDPSESVYKSTKNIHITLNQQSSDSKTFNRFSKNPDSQTNLTECEIVSNQENPHDLALNCAIDSLDSRSFFSRVSKEFETICRTLAASNPWVIPNTTIQLKLPNLKVSYNLPSLAKSSILEAEFGFRNFLSRLPFEDFVVIFLSILLEKTIVFVSEHAHSLSAAIATIKAIICPFRWSFPIIYSLPEECMLMLESPVPLLIGLNTSSHHFLSKIAPNHFTDLKTNDHILFILLDENLLIAPKPLLNSLNMPYFDDFLIVLQVIYKKSFNPKPSAFIKISKKKAKNGLRKYSLSRNSSYTYNGLISKLRKNPPKENQVSDMHLSHILFKDKFSTELFEYMSGTMQKFIISKLPKLTQNENGADNQEFVTELKPEKFSSNPFDVVFLRNFFGTQAFHFYFETQYLNRIK